VVPQTVGSLVILVGCSAGLRHAVAAGRRCMCEARQGALLHVLVFQGFSLAFVAFSLVRWLETRFGGREAQERQRKGFLDISGSTGGPHSLPAPRRRSSPKASLSTIRPPGHSPRRRPTGLLPPACRASHLMCGGTLGHWPMVLRRPGRQRMRVHPPRLSNSSFPFPYIPAAVGVRWRARGQEEAKGELSMCQNVCPVEESRFAIRRHINSTLPFDTLA
jgi:hypothetical protein